MGTNFTLPPRRQQAELILNADTERSGKVEGLESALALHARNQNP